MYTQSPRVLGVTSYALGATTRATHAVVVKDEVLGYTNGTPGQTFRVQHAPVLNLRSSETIEIEELRDGELVSFLGRASTISRNPIASSGISCWKLDRRN